MSEAEMKDLIDRLQRINRRWKIIALISTSFLAVVLLATGVSAVVQWKRVKAERETAMRMYREAMAEFDRVQREADKADRLQREANKAMNDLDDLKEVDKAKKKE
jgi:hypothetical protein